MSQSVHMMLLWTKSRLQMWFRGFASKFKKLGKLRQAVYVPRVSTVFALDFGRDAVVDFVDTRRCRSAKEARS